LKPYERNVQLVVRTIRMEWNYLPERLRKPKFWKSSSLYSVCGSKNNNHGSDEFESHTIGVLQKSAATAVLDRIYEFKLVAQAFGCQKIYELRCRKDDQVLNIEYCLETWTVASDYRGTVRQYILRINGTLPSLIFLPFRFGMDHRPSQESKRINNKV